MATQGVQTHSRPSTSCSAAVYVIGVVVIGFLLHPVHHFDPAWFAVLGAVVLCISTNPMDVEEVLENVGEPLPAPAGCNAAVCAGACTSES